MNFLRPLFDREDVTVIVRSGAVRDLIQRLVAHELDIVLSNHNPPRAKDDTWVVHTIDQQPVSLVGPPPVRSLSLEALLTEVPLVLPTVESGVRIAFDGLVERLGLRPRIAAEVDDMAMLRLVARGHRGLAVLPPVVVQDELDGGALVEHRQLPGINEPFFAITVPRRLRHPLLDELLGPLGADRSMDSQLP